MFIVDLLAAAAEAGAAPQNKFGFKEALEQGGFIAYATVVILGGMSFGSFFILFTKWLEQSKILRQYNELKASFWKAPDLKSGAAKLDKNSAWRQLAALQAATEPGGVLSLNVLIEGTTFLGMFGPEGHCLFEPGRVRERFAGWERLHEAIDSFEAPGGTTKRFLTLIARRPLAA